jgi:hypothetical protein
MSTPFIATCRCGGVRFQSPRAPILQLTCHCQQCREASGAPCTNFAFFKLADTELTGATKNQAYVADSGSNTLRASCAQCGDLMLDRTEGFPQIVGVVAERIQAPFEFNPRCHVWVENKLPEVVMPEAVRAFAKGME